MQVIYDARPLFWRFYYQEVKRKYKKKYTGNKQYFIVDADVDFPAAYTKYRAVSWPF